MATSWFRKHIKSIQQNCFLLTDSSNRISIRTHVDFIMETTNPFHLSFTKIYVFSMFHIDMGETDLSKIDPSTKENEQEWKNLSQNLIPTPPKSVSWNGGPIHLYEGMWYPEHNIKGLLYLQKYLKLHDSDIILTSFPKSGTNWLQALSFAIVNRSRYSLKETPLLTCSISQLVPIFEANLFQEDRFPDLDIFTQPRMFVTHAAYGLLPCSIKDGRKIVYICRNPLDQFISLWIFLGKLSITTKMATLDEAFESFCQGNHGYGPFWDHILGYWHASVKRPDKVLFLKYEDLKRNNIAYVKKLASFLGFPFSEEEERQGLAKEISEFCSFDNFKNLEVNKTGKTLIGDSNDIFFRKGQVGDFHNYLSPDQVLKMEKLIEEKFGPHGLSFDFS